MNLWDDLYADQILARLVARGVDFVVIGGVAAVLHGSPRITHDVDLCYSTSKANLKALGRALTDLNAKLWGVEDDVPFVPDQHTLARVELLTLVTDLGRLDVMTPPRGCPSYERLRAEAVPMDLGEFVVQAASIPHLISMKQAVGRDKDKADVAELQAILRLSRRTR